MDYSELSIDELQGLKTMTFKLIKGSSHSKMKDLYKDIVVEIAEAIRKKLE